MEVPAINVIPGLIVSLIAGLLVVAAIVWAAQEKTRHFGQILFLSLLFFEMCLIFIMHFISFKRTGAVGSIFEIAIFGLVLSAFFGWQAFHANKSAIIENIKSKQFKELYIGVLTIFLGIFVAGFFVSIVIPSYLIDAPGYLISLVLSYYFVRKKSSS